MKICISSQGDKPESAVDPRFGRCQYFAIYDTDSKETEFLSNGNKDGMGGIGIQSGQFMADKGVEVVLTGNVGPNAYQTLAAGNIKVVSGVSGKVSEVIEKYLKGGYDPAGGPSVDSHFGTN